MENREMNNQLQIELKEDVAQGTYANLAVIMQRDYCVLWKKIQVNMNVHLAPSDCWMNNQFHL